ncbi:MAG: hypothetical protein IT429_18235 [Gemmataceae bacterium]|nr:hypothetical protein [Gemmataceae bacterium]
MRSIERLIGCATLAATLALAAGCTSRPEDGKGKDGQAATDKGKVAPKHDHPTRGPHGGALAEWGEEKYHVEFTLDRARGQVAVYVLDGSAKKPAPVKAEGDTLTLTVTSLKPPLAMTLKADPQEGDPKGQASRFTGGDKQLVGQKGVEGEIGGKVGDTPYTGTFVEAGAAKDAKKE